MSAITLTVKEVRKAAELIRMVTLVAPDGGTLPPYEAGAHAEVHLPDGATRPYSLIDFDGAAKEPKAYVFGIRLEDESRGGSRFMHGLAEGDTVPHEAGQLLPLRVMHVPSERPACRTPRPRPDPDPHVQRAPHHQRVACGARTRAMPMRELRPRRVRPPRPSSP